MTICHVDFCSREEAQTHAGHYATALISITDPDSPAAALADGYFSVLRTSFHDILESIDGYRLFDRSEAERLVLYLNWLHSLPDEIRLLCHCEAGVSRSAAVAVFAAALSKAVFPRFLHATLSNRHVLRTLNACEPVVDARAPEPDPDALARIERLMQFSS